MEPHLHSASVPGYLQVVRSPLRHGVCVDPRLCERIPLQLASQLGHRAFVQCLIDQGVDVVSHSQDEVYNTLLSWGGHWARRCRSSGT